jgi:hypothetical protein
VYIGAYIFFTPVVPPAFVVDQRYAVPPVEGELQALVALALVRPIEELDEFVPREIDLYVLEVVSQPGEVNQGDDHVRIGGGRQTVSVAAGDGQPPVPVLEIEGFLPLGSVVREQGDGELGQVHLVPADERGEGDRLV